MDQIKMLGMAGSLRSGSYNRAALEAAAELVPDNTTLEIFDLSDIPLFNQDRESNPPEPVRRLKQRIEASDAIVISTPEYNYSVPGVLKNAIDWASRPYGQSSWDGKPAAIMGASPGRMGTARAQYHLRQMFVFLNVHALNRPEVMISDAAAKFDAQGNLIDADTRKRIVRLLEALSEWTVRLRVGARDGVLV
ncbi:NAD(P)H-dependent oxidoreductase [Candidatus Parcubacteria bacterium]|nr:NAD(P)H-dependent oxidoreductase [Candidatus Parcubacteria bacterium]